MTALRALLDDRVLGSVPMPGYAVTPALREWYAEGDTEELEYSALTLAAKASVRLLDADQDAPRRRVVVVADLALVEPVPHVDRAAVKVMEPVIWSAVHAVHIDHPDAIADVTAAADAVVEADLGSEDAAFRLEVGHELQWYATQEIGPLLELG